MKILFIVQEHPADPFGGMTTFVKNYLQEIRKSCEVVSVFFNYHPDLNFVPDEYIDYVITPREHKYCCSTLESDILETAAELRGQVEPIIKQFNPDIIHCNDRQTYLPFRYDKNVFYSLHLLWSDLLHMSILDDVGFNSVKIEKCALQNASLLCVYSDFIANRALKLVLGKSMPIVLNLGVNLNKFQNYMRDKSKKSEQLHITFFGRFENGQKGFLDFVNAVNILGQRFKETNSIIYSLFGRGEIGAATNLSLFEEPKFLQGDELLLAYKEADIVVMPSRYEPFGLVGLEAMATGSLVLLPKGCGMDMYATPNENCLEITNNPDMIATVLRDAVENYDKYDTIRKKGVATAEKWTWKRCALSHVFAYNRIKNNQLKEYQEAYSFKMRKVVLCFSNADKAQKNYVAQSENMFLAYMDQLKSSYKNQKCLLLTELKHESILDNNVTFISTLEEDANGIIHRIECLPYENNSFDKIYIFGSWEDITNPKLAMRELKRVAKSTIIIFYYTGTPFLWQTFQVKKIDDWAEFQDIQKDVENKDEKKWIIQNMQDVHCDFNHDYDFVEFKNQNV